MIVSLEVREDADMVSVVVPAYNAAAVIEAQLDALERQRYAGRFEILIVDNCSTDDLSGVVNQVALAHPDRVRVIPATCGRGVSFARNAGLRAARGWLVCVCDADDIVDEGWISALVDAAKHADLVAGALHPHPDNSPLAIASRSADFWDRVPNTGFLPYAIGANMAVRRRVALEAGGWSTSYSGGSDDTEFSWRVQIMGGRFAFAPEARVHYRLREGKRDLWRQHVNYGRGLARLARDFEPHGFRRNTKRNVAASLLRSLLLLPRGPQSRRRALVLAAHAIGEFQVSVGQIRPNRSEATT